MIIVQIDIEKIDYRKYVVAETGCQLAIALAF